MKKIKWGVMGTAGIARGFTIPGIRQTDNGQLYAVASRNLEKAEAFQKELGFEKAYGSYEELLADPQVDAVYIPLPNTLHYEWTIKALQAKKHVLCEKPMAPNAELATQMVACAKENGVFLMEAFAYLHSPYTAAIKEELKSGTIGDVVYMESTFITSDYDTDNIRMWKATYGGSLYDLGCYTTSQILWLLEEEPRTIQAIAELSEDGIDTFTTGIMTFAGKKKACFQCGMVLATEQGKRIDRLQIHGTKGSLIADAQFNQCGELTYSICVDGQEIIKTVQTPHNYMLETQQLGRCILNGETPHVSNEFTIANAKVMDTILAKIGY